MIFWRKLSVLLVGLMVLAAAPALRAQDGDADQDTLAVGEWAREGKFGLNLLQSYYTENWNGGDKGSVVWSANFDYLAQSQISRNWNLAYQLNLAYGQSHQQDREGGELVWRKPDKTTDQIKFDSMLRRTLDGGWAPYFSFRFESLFEDLNDPKADAVDARPRSITINPLRFTEALGVSRMLVKNEKRSLLARFGAAFHQSSRVYWLDPPGVSEDKIREGTLDGGLELIFNYRAKILQEKVDYESRLTFYQPLLLSMKDDLEAIDPDLYDYAKTLDVDWESTFITYVTEAINIQLYLRWMYDKYDNTVAPVLADDGSVDNVEDVAAAVRKKGQFKQTLSLGVAYTF